MPAKKTIQYILLPILSGFFLVCTLPPFNLSLFLWFFLVPLLFFADKEKRKKRFVFAGGLVAGLIYFVMVAYPLSSLNAWWWIDASARFYENKEVFLLLFVLVISLCASIFYGLFALFYRKFRRHNIRDVLVFPLLWVVLEYVRAKVLLGFTWGHIGYALHDNVFILQLAKPFGVYGLGFFIIAINILVYLFIRRAFEVFTHRTLVDVPKKLFEAVGKNSYLYIVIFLFALASLYGFWTIKSGEKALLTEKELKVAVVQGGLKTRDEKTEGFYKKFIADALEYNPDIIVLPENTLWFLVVHKRTKLPLWYEMKPKIKESYDEIVNISREHKDTSFVIGLHTTQDNKEYNSLVVMENGEITGMYDKRFLMPFSETGLFASSASAPPGVFLSKGADDQVVRVKGAPITPLICSEIIFPELTRDKNARFIVNSGNDSVFDSQLVAQQNHIISKIRAVENRKFVIRSMKTGVSSIIDPFGRVITWMGTKESGTLVGTIRY